MRWQGMTVPSLYARMAGEFEDAVRSGDYADWVAANQRPALIERQPRVGGVSVVSQPTRNGNANVTRHVVPAPAGRAVRRRRLSPRPALGR